MQSVPVCLVTWVVFERTLPLANALNLRRSLPALVGVLAKSSNVSVATLLSLSVVRNVALGTVGLRRRVRRGLVLALDIWLRVLSDE